MPFPRPTHQGRWDWQLGHALDRELRAALGNPQDKRRIRQTYSRRSARIATKSETRPKAKLIRPTFKLPKRLSTPSHSSADRRLRPLKDLPLNIILVMCKVLKGVFTMLRGYVLAKFTSQPLKFASWQNLEFSWQHFEKQNEQTL